MVADPHDVDTAHENAGGHAAPPARHRVRAEAPVEGVAPASSLSEDRETSLEERVLVVAPSARDAQYTKRIFAEAGIACLLCAGLDDLCQQLAAGVGAVLVSEESLLTDGADRLAAALESQPPWSDLPLLVLTREGSVSLLALQTMERLGNVTLLERPVRVPSLVSAAQSALRARRRQYQMREHLAEVQRINRALQQADRSKDEFLAMLAHELRNPLAPIVNALALMKRESGADGEAPLRELISRQVDHLVRLVDDLLDVSRILRGKIELRVEPIDLREAITRAIETAQPLLDSQRHELQVSLPHGPLTVRGDLVRLSQVFANLLNNAAKYTEPEGHLAVAAERSGDDLVVRVRDDGIGISGEMLPRVFELFSQAERSLDRSQGGLGLGLTLVRQLVEMHGGRVEVRSEGLGRGSEFLVRLPAAAAPAGRTAPRNGFGESRVPSRRILVVDDNTDAADSLAALLRRDGHVVSVSYHGGDALETARAQKPEVVLLDIGLPGVDGYDVARALRQIDATMMIVAVTGYGQDEDRRRAVAAGFDHHMTKPVLLPDLARVLAAVPR